MITIAEYKQAEQELKKIQEEKDKEDKVYSKEKESVYHKFYALERELEQKKRKENERIESKNERFRAKMSTKEIPHVEMMEAYKRILSFMEIKKDKRNLPFEVYKYDYPRDEHGEVIRVQRGNCSCYPEKIKIHYGQKETIKNDEYAVIKVFIVENDKPKNKFSLVVVGSSIFPGDLFTQKRDFYSYGLSCRTDHNTIQLLIKDKPTKDELLQYLERRKESILGDYLVEHGQLEKDYEEAIRLTDNKQWELAYWEDKKYYYEHHYSRGTETEEYKAVLKQIKLLEE